MSAAMHTIRPAKPSDLAQLSALGRRTFVETFRDGFGIPYPQADLDTFIEEAFGEFSIAQALADRDQTWWVAADETGRLGGFANIGPCALPHPDASEANGELKRLYIGKHAQGQGLGTKLLDTALAAMAERFTGPEWIGVWSGNDKAVRLYGHYRFHRVGEYKFPVGDWLDDEFILRRG
jgi:ribosomal protein S18 acetylase RimI-like enzyme